MDNIYLVIANSSREISYGVDNHTYLCGVYSDKESADKRVEDLKHKIEDVRDELISIFMDEIDDDVEEIYKKAKKHIGFDVTPMERSDDAIEWSIDFSVIECPFGNIIDECLLGGANYME